MNQFMIEGGFPSAKFLSNFELEYIQFDSSDAIMNFQPKDKLLMMAKYIIGSMLIEKILLSPKENGFNTEILKQS